MRGRLPSRGDVLLSWNRALALIEAEIVRGAWVDPALSRQSFAGYAERWLGRRPGLAPRTHELYRALRRLHILPVLGSRDIRDITPAVIRGGRQGLIDGGHLAAATGASTRELMGRVGHSSMRAALIYQHRTADRDRVIADALNLLVERVEDLVDESDRAPRDRMRNRCGLGT